MVKVWIDLKVNYEEIFSAESLHQESISLVDRTKGRRSVVIITASQINSWPKRDTLLCQSTDGSKFNLIFILNFDVVESGEALGRVSMLKMILISFYLPILIQV